jgi:hypothetical protein
MAPTLVTIRFIIFTKLPFVKKMLLGFERVDTETIMITRTPTGMDYIVLIPYPTIHIPQHSVNE